jgi:hypothetical protein
MPYKIASLNLNPSKGANTIGEIFIAQPDAHKESLAGKLFILVEINSSRRERTNALKIINFLIDRLNHNYYQNEKILLREKIESLRPEHILEAALARTNSHLNDFINQEKIKLNRIDTNITVGLIYENKLHFTNSGKNKIFLIIKKPALNEKKQTQPIEPEDRYQIIDLTKKFAPEKKKKNVVEKKIFIDVISGEIPPRSYLFFTNETLPEYISIKQIKKIISTLPPAGAIEQIKNILTKINAYVGFLGIVVKNTVRETEIKPIPRQTGTSASQESVLSLNRTEEKTENLLTPSGMIKIKKWLALKNLLTKQKKDKSTTIVLKDKIYVKKRTSYLLKKIWQQIINIFKYIATLFYLLAKSCGSWQKFKKFWSQIYHQFITKIKKWLFHPFLHLNRRQKILLGLSLTFLLIFAANLTFYKIQKQQEEKNKFYTELKAKIEKKQNQIEANLLYSNEEGAKKLFTEINKLMEQLPQETEEEQKTYRIFQEKITQQIAKIRRIKKITTPTLLIDLSTIDKQAAPTNIIQLGKKIYLADSQQKSIYILNLGDNLVTTFTDLTKPIEKLKLPVRENENKIYYFNKENIVEFDVTNKIINLLPINLPAEESLIVGADAYNSRLYLLDKKNNQIYRYNRLVNGFGSPYSWIKEKINLNEAVDMSIDGHIYILKDNGQVLKFLRGRKIDFKLEEIDLPLTNPTRIKTFPDSKYIYILEVSAKRLAVFDKNGQYIMRYEVDSFNQWQDFIVDEKNKIIYALSNSSLYGFPASHLEE